MQPTSFINLGGGACFFLEPGPMRDTWRELEDYLHGLMATFAEQPRAILAISGRSEEGMPTVNAGAQPPLLFDYGGFPDYAYRLVWRAPGAPDLAFRVRELLLVADIASGMETARGWDHGIFVPLKAMVPGADSPLVQLSLQHGLDPASHLAIGRALKAFLGRPVMGGRSSRSDAALPPGRETAQKRRRGRGRPPHCIAEAGTPEQRLAAYVAFAEVEAHLLALLRVLRHDGC